jgi:hypothetical protein
VSRKIEKSRKRKKEGIGVGGGGGGVKNEVKMWNLSLKKLN